MTDETIFATALEKADPAARAAFVAEACADDPEQRRRIDALLAAHDRAGEFLARPAAAAPAGGATRSLPPGGADGPTRTHGGTVDTDTDEALGFLAPPGRPDSLGRIGHYEVLEVLGHGGFGIVFRAFDELLQRVVAVKVLAPSMAATSPARKRFVREATSCAKIRHENVVQVHEISRDDERLPYLVMEFIPGETLQQRLDRTGPLEVPEVLRLGRQIAAGLAAAHEMGLVHRDIKPSNVLIEGGPQGRVKITDFGLARAADDASISQSGVVAGTPMYMAPEQAKGEALDHRADLFSLGSVLYAMLTGRPPFRASGTLAVLKRVVEEDPRPIREIIPEVPEWLCRFVEKLHRKDPADRYQSAKEVAEVLADCEKQLAAHKELKDLSRIPEAKAEPAPRRTGVKWKWAAAALALVVALGGVWFGRAAMLHLSNQGELEIEPQEGLVSVIVLQNDEGVLDGNKLHAPVTDWLELKKAQTLKLPPGRYQLNVSTWPAGTKITEWEVTTSGPFGSNRVTVPVIRTSAIITVVRGHRVTIRARVSTTPVPPPSGTPDSDGFVPLFNGKDLAGWTPSPHSPGDWRVENGELVGRTGPGYLFSAKAYDNFHLRLEAKINADGNSGVAFGRNYQVEIRHDPLCPTGSLLDFKPDKTTSIIRFPYPTPAPDEWFTLELKVDGPSAAVRINGGPWNTLRAERAGAAPLELEALDTKTVVRFRRIEIRELPGSQSTPGQQAQEEAAKLNGEWVVRGGRVDGEPLAAGDIVEKLHLKDGTFTLPVRDDSGYPWALTGVYTVDAAKRQLSFKFNHEPLDVPPVLCGYRFEGDVLVLDFPEPKYDGRQSAGTLPFARDRRIRSQSNLKELGAAVLGYMNEHNDALPPAAITNPKDGKPLLSWRVALLPYLGEEKLYKRFKLDEPWDSEHNKKLIEKMPKVFKTPGVGADPGQTHYRVFVGPGTAFEPRAAGAGPLTLLDFHDGLSNTILVLEAAANPVVWTKPEDLPYDPKKPLPKLVGADSVGTHVLMGDGSVCRMLPEARPAAIRAAIERSDGEAASQQLFRRIPRNGPAVYLELRRAAAGAAAPRPVLLKAFDPTKDRAVPLRGDAKQIVSVEDGAWRIENAFDPSESGNFRVALGTIADGIPEDGVLIVRAKVKLKPAAKNGGWGSLELNGASPSFHGSSWPDHLGEYRGEITGWGQKEVRYPVEVIRKKNPPTVTVHVGLHGNGVLWVKDVELLHLPASPDPGLLEARRNLVTVAAVARDIVKSRYEVGAASKLELVVAEIDLVEDRIKLAEAEGDAAEVVGLHEVLVAHRKEERYIIAVRVGVGVDGPKLLADADARLAEAQARLAKLKPPPPEAPAPRAKN